MRELALSQVDLIEASQMLRDQADGLDSIRRMHIQMSQECGIRRWGLLSRNMAYLVPISIHDDQCGVSLAINCFLFQGYVWQLVGILVYRRKLRDSCLGVSPVWRSLDVWVRDRSASQRFEATTGSRHLVGWV
jgi:hypothetical protein